MQPPNLKCPARTIAFVVSPVMQAAGRPEEDTRGGFTHSGRGLITGKELVRMEPDGSILQHADLSDVASFGWNEIVVDGRGNGYHPGQVLITNGPASGAGWP